MVAKTNGIRDKWDHGQWVHDNWETKDHGFVDFKQG
jgi:hypothetical protein